MSKTLSFLLMTLFFLAGSAHAAFIANAGDGRFEFRLDVRHGSYVNYAKLDMKIEDAGGLDQAMVFTGITITAIGQRFVLTPADTNYSAATAFLTTVCQT